VNYFVHVLCQKISDDEQLWFRQPFIFTKQVRILPVIAFDSKQFRRGKIILVQTPDGASEKYLGFNSQLGVGVLINNESEFMEKYLKKSEELQQSFDIKENLPFYSSTHLKQSIGLPKAIAFADQLITAVQSTIESIHCSYIILPPARTPSVFVGGLKCPTEQKPTAKFIDALGPMFSYLTAHSYLYTNGFSISSDVKMHIDAFRSYRTRAWETILSCTKPQVFWKGDECNPFISCADILAFLTDVKLYDQRLKLEPNDIERAWNMYDFDVKTNFYDEKSLSVYSWPTKENIDYTQFVAKPTVFLAVDEIEKLSYGEEQEESLSEQIGVSNKTGVRKFHQVIKQTDVYYSAIRYAYQKGGSMKIFKRSEDMHMVQDGDVFVYVGDNSKRIGQTFQHAHEIEVLSGVELRKKTKNPDV